MTLREQVGRLVIVGVEGTQLSALESAWLRVVRPSGVILFRRNIEQAAQVTGLLREATKACGAPIFRCVDIEGGLVDRLRDLIAPVPAPAAVFATGKRTLYARHGRLIAREARALGFNTVFAPVLDLALPQSAAVLRSRAVSAKPAGVIAYAQAFLMGLQAGNILGCGKHFPGLGGGTLDSHHTMPRIERTWEQMSTEDLAPFRTLAAQLPLIMVAHAAYPRVHDTVPASISPFWISTVLKRHIGFRGLVISDDMEMGGILTQVPIEEAAIKAVLAGTDLVEICRGASLVLRAYEALLAEAERSAAFRRRVIASCLRIMECKTRLLNTREPRSASPAQISRLRAEVQKLSEEIA